MKTLALIDVAGIFRSAWAASEGQEVNAAFNVTLKRVREICARYDYAAVCLDSPPYRRKQISADYKAHRPKPSEALLGQYKRVKQRLADDGVALFAADGYEADDVIATLVTQAVAMPQRFNAITVVSADKDLMQLVNDKCGVKAYDWSTGATFDESAVTEEFGVAPSGIRDLLALTGDASDNIAGVKGVGPATAATIVNSGPGLDGALKGEAIKGLSPRFANMICNARDAIGIYRRLVTLEYDAPVSLAEVFVTREPKKVIDAEFEDEKSGEFERPRSEPPPPPPVGTAGAAPNGPRKHEPSAALVKLPEPPKEWSLHLEPRTTAEAWTMAVKLHNSRLFPQFSTPEAVFAIILRGRSIGLDAVTSLSTFHMVDGKPTMHASLIVGLVLKSGLAEYFDLVESTNEKATWATKRRGGRREVPMSFDVRDALNAGLLVGTPDDARGVSSSGRPSNWDKYRRTMLRWRAATELARAIYPDITTGIYTPDEISDGTHDVELEAKYAAA